MAACLIHRDAWIASTLRSYRFGGAAISPGRLQQINKHGNEEFGG